MGVGYIQHLLGRCDGDEDLELDQLVFYLLGDEATSRMRLSEEEIERVMELVVELRRNVKARIIDKGNKQSLRVVQVEVQVSILVRHKKHEFWHFHGELIVALYAVSTMDAFWRWRFYF